MNRLHTHYGGHVENLNAALKDNSSDDAREALSLLRSDGVAQVMSFMSERSLNSVALTVAAASPEMRLDATVLTNDNTLSPDGVLMWTIGQRLLLAIYARGSREMSPALVNSLWWAERQRMPVHIYTDNACSDFLGLLSDDLRSRVEALDIHVDEGTVCARFSSQETESTTAACDGECGTLLCALPTFPNLMSLSIEGIRGQGSERLYATVRSALSLAADMQISNIKLQLVKYSRDFSLVPLSPRLRGLTVDGCDIRSFAGLERHSMLTYLNVSGNFHLRSLHGIAGAPMLENITAQFCNLQDVKGLSQCQRLREVDVSTNRQLRSLGGLAGAPRLEKVSARGCNLQDVEALSQCVMLTYLNVCGNCQLQSLGGLAGASRLEKVVALGCNLQDVEGLGQCLHLREVNVSSNSNLHSLMGLAGAPSLERVEAERCELQDVDGLSQCLQLREINVTENTASLDLRDLASASNLQRIIAEDCALLGVEELRSRLPSCKLIL